jgi:ribokinase
MGRVHVVGSINQDIVVEATRHPRPGETVVATTLRMHPGGKGANQAVAAARAGAAAALIGCVGDDAAGRELLSVIQAAGVACSAVRVIAGVPTGTGFITLAAGENTIVVVPGANALVGPDSAQVGFAPGDVCVAQLETPVETTADAFRRAKAAGATIVFNPAPADEVPDALLALADIVVVNAHEFGSIFEVSLDSCLSADHPPTPVRFRGSIIATRGAEGAVIWNGGGPVLIPGHPVAMVDSTGAGDCFVGYLAAGLADGLLLEQAARRGNRAASISVTRHGAISSIPRAAELG